jgi:hypothetical protein
VHILWIISLNGQEKASKIMWYKKFIDKRGIDILMAESLSGPKKTDPGEVEGFHFLNSPFGDVTEIPVKCLGIRAPKEEVKY